MLAILFLSSVEIILEFIPNIFNNSNPPPANDRRALKDYAKQDLAPHTKLKEAHTVQDVTTIEKTIKALILKFTQSSTKYINSLKKKLKSYKLYTRIGILMPQSIHISTYFNQFISN